MKQVILTSLLALGLPLSGYAAECNLPAGQEVFKKCAACHTTDKGAGHFVGPNLNGLIGREIGAVEGFKFSRQMRKDKRTWDQALFDQFITDPAAMFSRTRMGFAGIKDTTERNDLFCYLKSLEEK